jgi:hypothetical protein
MSSSHSYRVETHTRVPSTTNCYDLVTIVLYVHPLVLRDIVHSEGIVALFGSRTRRRDSVMEQRKHFGTRRGHPVTNHNVMVVAGRVVRIQTQHVGESNWVATGHLSESLPTRKRLASPMVVSATGRTEEQAIEALKQLIQRRGDDIEDRVGHVT